MKNTLTKTICIFLALTCALGLFGTIRGLNEIMECKEYWEEVKEEALDQFTLLDDGIKQLSENRSTYTEGVDTYETGLETYEEGIKTLEDGEAQLEEGKIALEEGKATLAASSGQLSAGHATYDEAVKKLEAGKAQLAAGEAELAKNTQAYEEGKAQLAEVTGIYYLVMTTYRIYESAKSNLAKARESGDETSIAYWEYETNRLESLVNADLSGYTISYIVTNYEEGQAKLAEYEAAAAKIEAAKATIAENEALLAQAKTKLDSGDAAYAEGKNKLAEGEATIAENEVKLAEGKKALADGADQLETGKSQLAMYEDGQRQVAEGCGTAIGTDTYYNDDGKALVKSIKDRLGDDFTVYAVENGEEVVLNGEKLLNLENCSKVSETGRAFVADTETKVTKELTGRAIALIIAAVACAAGIVLSIMGIKGARILGVASIVCALIALAGTIAEALSFDTGYPLTKIAGGNGDALSMYVMIALIVFTMAIGAMSSNKKAPAAVEEEE